MERCIALTGASGFLGRRLAATLADRGWRVRALLRRPLAPENWEGPAPDCIPGDLADPAALARLTEGTQATIHCAGLIKARDRAAFFEVNAEGAARMARATGGRMILVSSLVAREPRLSDYAASKRAGEAAAAAVLGARLTVVRPPAIYGPGDLATLPFFRLAARAPLAPTPSVPGGRVALAFVDDVARVIVDMAEAPAGAGPYALGGDRPEGYSWAQIIDAIAAAVGRHPRRVPLPAPLISAAGGVSEAFAALFGRAAMFTRGKARELLHADWSVSVAEQAPESAAWRPTPLAAGLARTVTWYRTRGWL